MLTAKTCKDTKQLIAVAQNVLAESIPVKYMVPAEMLPPKSQLDVHNFPAQSGLMSPKELQITETSSVDIVKAIANGEWTAEEVTVAFARRAVISHQVTNFATEFLISDALAHARDLDRTFKKTGRVVGPLHGLPISVKEHISMEGRITHGSYIAWIDKISSEDATLVKLLKKAGAVFHVRTNQPQSLMHLDCDNNIYGRTYNPFNRNLTSGGSSGGEGVSIGMKASPMGVGTDSGGSIRQPASCNGVYGFRPTTLRLPHGGTVMPGMGQESIRCVIGPLGQGVDDLELFMKSVLDQSPWDYDPSLVPVPWRSSMPSKNITVGVIWDDGIVRPHPPIQRALRETVAKLKAYGVKKVTFQPYKHDLAWKIISALYFPDGAAAQKDVLAEAGEMLLPLTEWAFGFSHGPLTIAENWHWNVQREKYRTEYHEVMKSKDVDVIICPAYVGVAPEHGTAHYWNYTSVWNLLDHPACVFPFGGVVDPKLDKPEFDYKPRNEQDNCEWKKYCPETFLGAPIGLQVVGKRYHDEEVLAATRVIESALRADNLG
ncbi:fatty-acid amide hydrolase [Penicillium malachiteum]|uniref:amidase n=1 Tax=Penicillium malachiteum TaxID=1324776 RepID=A0AAD6N1A6_9EURO|nr:fatty-acid amide hydrolase [Penicillium malachiteum]